MGQCTWRVSVSTLQQRYPGAEGRYRDPLGNSLTGALFPVQGTQQKALPHRAGWGLVDRDAGIELTGNFSSGRVLAMDNITAIIHVGKLDGKVVKTTWAEDKKEAKRLEGLLLKDGADRTRIFSGKGMFGGLGAKFRIVGYWP